MASNKQPLSIRLATNAGIEVNSGAWARLLVRQGDIWVTYPGSEDLIVSEGESIDVPKQAWVLAMSETQLQVSMPAAPKQGWLSRWWDRVEAAYLRVFLAPQTRVIAQSPQLSHMRL